MNDLEIRAAHANSHRRRCDPVAFAILASDHARDRAQSTLQDRHQEAGVAVLLARVREPFELDFGIAAHRHQRAVGHAQLGERADCGDDVFAFVELGRALRHALWRAFATDAHVADDGQESTRFCALRADRARGRDQRREEHQVPARFNKHLHVSSLEVQAQTVLPALYPAKEKCPTLSLNAQTFALSSLKVQTQID